MTPINIDRVELRHARLRLVRPFRTSFGLERDREVILATVHAEGLAGWGECVASATPGYSYETATTAWHVLKDFLVPDLLDEPVDAPQDVAARWSRFRGHEMAKAGLEGALWDLFAQAAGKSLAAYLWDAGGYAGQQPGRVSVGVSCGIEPTIEETIEVIAGWLELGYRRIKLKVKPGWDVQLLESVREEFPDVKLMADANSAYTLDDAPTLREFDRFGLTMVEQPLYHDDIYQHSRLQDQMQTPLCLDESILHTRDAQHALDVGACRIINIKPGRVGGLGEAQRIHDYCYQRQVPVWCGGMLESGIGRAANVAIATLPGYVLPGDISASSRYFSRDIINEPFELNALDSTLTAPDGPGLGVTLDVDYLSTLLVREAELRKS